MENNEQKFVTVDILNEAFGKFAEDILLPAFQSVTDELGTIKEKISSMDEKIGSMDEKIGSMDKRISSMDERISGMDEKIDSLDAKVERNSLDIFNLQESVHKINNKLDILVKTESEDVSAVACPELVEWGMDIGQLKHGFKNHELRIAALEKN